jgi:hypothetical protein
MMIKSKRQFLVRLLFGAALAGVGFCGVNDQENPGGVGTSPSTPAPIAPVAPPSAPSN